LELQRNPDVLHMPHSFGEAGLISELETMPKMSTASILATHGNKIQEFGLAI